MASNSSDDFVCLAHAKTLPEPHGTHLVASSPVNTGQRLIEEKGILKDVADVHTIQVSYIVHLAPSLVNNNHQSTKKRKAWHGKQHRMHGIVAPLRK
jgi:hypothetical protein